MSNQSAPIVPHVLYVAEQRHPWRLAPIKRLAVRYHTPTTVRLATGVQATKQQTHVYCLADDAAWERAQAQHITLQQALDALADALRQLGSYSTRLKAAGGIKQAPNPLSPTVIAVDDPDHVYAPSLFLQQRVPTLRRYTVEQHTPQMLKLLESMASINHQRDHFVCPTDADWAHVEQLHQTAEATATQWDDLLRELGTYQAALADGRYQHTTKMEEAMQALPAIQSPRLVETRKVAETDLDGDLLDRLQDEGYTWESAKRTPDGRWHHVVRKHSGFHGRLRRERLEVLVVPASVALAVVEPMAHAGVVMMDALESRKALAAIQDDLGQAEEAERSARQKLLDWKEREGWRALGYASFVAGVQAEIKDWKKAHIYRLLGAAQVERILGVAESPVGDSEIPERQLRELLPLVDNPNAVRSAWQQANDLAGDRPRTTAHVQQAVQAVKPPAAPPFDLPPDLVAAGATVERADKSGTLQLRIGSWRSSAVRNVPALITEARNHLDDQAVAAARKILVEAQKWAESARTPLYRDAYAQARQVRDLAKRDALVAEIDAAIDGTAITVAPAPDKVPITPEARDADGPWFWASKSVSHPTAHHWRVRPMSDGGYVAACGVTMPSLPATGTNAGRCSVCAKHADRRETVPIPVPMITISTRTGQQRIQLFRLSADLALHPAVSGTDAWTITHRLSGRRVAGFARQWIAEAVFDGLAALDWSGCTAEGGVPAAIAEQINAIRARYGEAAVSKGELATTPAMGNGLAATVEETTLEVAPVTSAADTHKAQARAKTEALLRTVFAALRSETIVLRLIALGICDRDQRVQVAEMPLAQLHELLIGRIFAGAWSGDPAPLLALLQLDAAAPASALPALADDSPLAEIAATLAGVERALRRELPPADVEEYQELLDRLMEDLEAQADAPDVSDVAYDALATRIGDAQRQLAERLVVESEVAA